MTDEAEPKNPKIVPADKSKKNSSAKSKGKKLRGDVFMQLLEEEENNHLYRFHSAGQSQGVLDFHDANHGKVEIKYNEATGEMTFLSNCSTEMVLKEMIRLIAQVLKRSGSPMVLSELKGANSWATHIMQSACIENGLKVQKSETHQPLPKHNPHYERMNALDDNDPAEQRQRVQRQQQLASQQATSPFGKKS